MHWSERQRTLASWTFVNFVEGCMLCRFVRILLTPRLLYQPRWFLFLNTWLLGSPSLPYTLIFCLIHRHSAELEGNNPPLSPPTSHLRGNLENLCYLRDLSLLSERAPCRRTAVSLNLNVSHFVRTISIQYSNQKEKFGNRVSRILRVPTLCNKWTFELDSVVNELLESNREQMIAF